MNFSEACGWRSGLKITVERREKLNNLLLQKVNVGSWRGGQICCPLTGGSRWYFHPPCQCDLRTYADCAAVSLLIALWTADGEAADGP